MCYKVSMQTKGSKERNSVGDHTQYSNNNNNNGKNLSFLPGTTIAVALATIHRCLCSTVSISYSSNNNICEESKESVKDEIVWHIALEFHAETNVIGSLSPSDLKAGGLDTFDLFFYS